MNSESAFNGLDVVEGRKQIMAMMKEQKWGTEATALRLRDWLVSRQVG
jgi:leucyl-tRNA synthetase